MSDQAAPDDGLRPRVVLMEAPAAARLGAVPAPQVIASEETARIVPAAPVAPRLATEAAGRRRSGAVRLGLYGVGAASLGWLGIDAYLWISSAFAQSDALGSLAAMVVAAGLAGAGLIIGRELKSFSALKSVEAHQRLFAEHADEIRPAELQRAVREVLAAIPQDPTTQAAIEAFQRKLQRHHTAAQQLELLSQTALAPLDRRAEAIVRRAAGRAFGITAISPTAITDAAFFLACSVGMVRDVAAAYGHRPTAAATAHLLRRLLAEAGKLGAVDLAGATLSQHVGGALMEKIAAGTAESMYATQRMARLGLVAMSLCRPVPFQPREVPGLFSALIGGLFAKRGQGPDAS